MGAVEAQAGEGRRVVTAWWECCVMVGFSLVAALGLVFNSWVAFVTGAGGLAVSMVIARLRA